MAPAILPTTCLPLNLALLCHLLTPPATPAWEHNRPFIPTIQLMPASTRHRLSSLLPAAALASARGSSSLECNRFSSSTSPTVTHNCYAGCHGMAVTGLRRQRGKRKQQHRRRRHRAVSWKARLRLVGRICRAAVYERCQLCICVPGRSRSQNSRWCGDAKREPAAYTTDRRWGVQSACESRRRCDGG